MKTRHDKPWWWRSLPAACAIALISGGLGTTSALAAPRTGAQIYQNILKKYPMAMNPDVRGLATQHPSVTLYVPENEWKGLTAQDRTALAGFMPALVKKVQSNPEAYVGIPESAPIYSRFLDNMKSIEPKNWEIVAGRWLPQKRTMTVDRTVSKGS